MAAEMGKDGYSPEIIGYAEPWIVAPGDSVAIKVSCTESEYSYRTIRLTQGIDLEHSPKKAEENMEGIPRGRCKGRFQSYCPGSYGLFDHRVRYGTIPDGGVDVSFFMQPWLLECSHTQTLVSTLNSMEGTGLSISLNVRGSLEISVATKDGIETITSELRPEEKKWSRVNLVVSGQTVRMNLTPKAFKVEHISLPTTGVWQLEAESQVLGSGPLLIAARRIADASEAIHSEVQATDFFNGRMDQLKLRTSNPHPLILGEYDFSLNMTSDRVMDVSGYGHHGVLVNAPTRGVKGHNWDISIPASAPAQFGHGAIHFHDDDLDDADWETDFTITIPQSARSGAYAVEVDAGLDTDSITFFVRPACWTSENSGKVCLILSTFTYLVNANECPCDTTHRNTAGRGPDFDTKKTVKRAEFAKMHRRTDLGHSCYDRHNDGSGVCFSSSKHPILSVRPGNATVKSSRPCQFSADLMMVGFLEREGIPYEVVTDHDLHARGASALNEFNTVITSCHPEYTTLASFGAYTAFAKRGGNLMYLGGNGYCWASALGETRPHRFKVRRDDTGVFAFGLPRREHFDSIEGKQGRLWRSHGMSCTTLFVQGADAGVPLKRTVRSRKTKLSWMFEGVDGDLIVESGFGGGSDIVYCVGAGRGSVFSVGSINWYCSLARDDYDNDVARLTGNVIRGFLEGRP